MSTPEKQVSNINFEFAYPFMRDRYKSALSRAYSPDIKLRHSLHNNAFLLPFVPSAAKPLGLGGALNADLSPIPLSFINSLDRPVRWGGAYRINPKACKFLPGCFIYMGPLSDHWGHLILDYSSRMYAMEDFPDATPVFLVPIGSNAHLHLAIFRFFELFGLPVNQIAVVNQPVQVEELIIPKQSYIPGIGYSNEYKQIFKKVANSIAPTAAQRYDKIYFSKLAWKAGWSNNEIGQEFLDDFFETNGFKVIYPEKESLDNQIFYLSNCKTAAMIEGSLVHNLVFANDATESIVIKKTHLVNNNILDSLLMHGAPATIVDTFYAGQPFDYGHGPFLLYPSQPFLHFAENRSYTSPKTAMDGTWQKNKSLEYIISQRKRYNSNTGNLQSALQETVPDDIVLTTQPRCFIESENLAESCLDLIDDLITKYDSPSIVISELDRALSNT